jgi:uncharacterized lipoprotein NlpE involved in copper resistance
MKKLFGFILLLSLLACNTSTNSSNNTETDSAKANEVASGSTDSSAANAKLNDGHNAQNSLDWFGTYEGTLPCADCPGIKTTIVLNQDNTYSKTAEYIERENSRFTEEGKIEWHDNGREITLIPTKGESEIYKVTEGSLVMLDKEGNEITGNLAPNYILKKK